LRSYKVGGTKEQYLDVYKRVGVYVAMNESLTRMGKDLGEMSKRIRGIELAPPGSLSRDEKKAKRDEVITMRNKTISKYMKWYNSVDWEAEQKKIDASLQRVGRTWDQHNGGK